jgi:hypothetical protein
MAKRRMFSDSVVGTDDFMDMPIGSKLLYFYLGMYADDDGFVDKPRQIMKTIGATEDDMKVLVTKKYLICFDSGVIVIRHWRLNNYLRTDRYTETIHLEEKSQLKRLENGVYAQENDTLVYQRYTRWYTKWYTSGIPR